MRRDDSVVASLKQLLPDVEQIEHVRSVGGGCISDAKQVRARFGDGTETLLFVKSNDDSFLDNFESECDGLSRLAACDAISIPRPLAVGSADGRSWLVLQWIDEGSRQSDFFETFGASLAQMHRVSLGDQVGLSRDNYLGSAHQINTPTTNWSEFFATHRIGYQIQWAVQQGVDAQLRRDCESIINQMPDLLSGRHEKTSLLHGDLWSGNYLCGVNDEPVLIDPAVYHGCREAEFGMLNLFGSCPPLFYESYGHHFPLPDGWQRRVRVYVLYHLLNHLNLFGSGYLGQCRSLAAEILRSRE
ncbi:MAG: fructosamine kinase family protein [Planctomycetota bacterium]